MRAFSYDKRAVGTFLVGIFAVPLGLLGLIAVVLVPLTAGTGPVSGACMSGA
ncbi:hypothetical protein K1W54_15695 [Micromonospora sp. CPCC 205371]|nr:hypothetical protein [Micromonospora sp. CPCC 205371]